MALVFYDTETTGTDTFFDQILQFAAIRTDEDLNELDRFEIRSRLLPHVVPTPEAMSLTGVSVAQLTDPSAPSHYEMVRAICSTLESWSPALFVGWNSIDFDENLIRQAFYKTLHNPYLTSRVGNSRSDVMRIVQACSLFAPDALVFPTNEDGNKTFKLTRIALVNGFSHDLAHEAVRDVEATIYLCRLLIEKAPDVWSSFMRFSKKAAVIDYISDENVFCLTDFYLGRPYSHLVTAIGQNAGNKAEWYVYDLSIEPSTLAVMTDEQLAISLREWPKPIRRLKSNGAPMIFPADDAPKTCVGREFGLGELGRRAERLKNDLGLRQKLIAVFESQRQQYPRSPHVEKQIYDGFIESGDEALMHTFHQATWEKRPAIVERFKDERLRTIGRRLIHIERPDLLDGATSQAHDVATAKRLLGECEEVSWLTLPRALAQLGEMTEKASGLELQHLQEHERFLSDRHQKALARAG